MPKKRCMARKPAQSEGNLLQTLRKLPARLISYVSGPAVTKNSYRAVVPVGVINLSVSWRWLTANSIALSVILTSPC